MKRLIRLVDRGIDCQFLLETAFGVLKAFAAPARERVSLTLAVGLQLM
jgi:hypothetical protein